MTLAVGQRMDFRGARAARAADGLVRLPVFRPLPNAWSVLGGASTQRPPDFSTWMMPLITRRSSTRALPRVSIGRCGSIFENCVSVSQN
jgi:hypothetical protein